MNSTQMEPKNDAVGKIVRVMETLVRADAASVREVASAAGIPRSTAHRFLSALERYGWVCQDAESGGYRAGVRFFLLCRRHVFFDELVRCARPAMKRLMERTGKTAILSVVEGGGGLCVCTEEPPMAVKFVARAGMDVPLNAGATGLVLLAYGGESLRERVVSREFQNGLAGAALKERVGLILRQGFAHSREEWMPNAEDLSVPVYGPRGDFAAQLGIAGLAGTFGDWEKDLLPALRGASAEITSAMQECRMKSERIGEGL